MWAWLVAKTFFKIPNGLFLIAAVVSILLALVLMEKADDKRNQKVGATVEREKSLGVVVKQAEKANVAREEIAKNGVAGSRVRYDQCVRSSRSQDPAASCRRFLFDSKTD